MQAKLQDDPLLSGNRRTDLKSRSRLMTATTMVLCGLVLAGVLLAAASCGGDKAAGAGSTTSTKRHTTSSQKSLVEAQAKTDLQTIKNVSFVSILLVDASGSMTSYGVSTKLQAAQKLIEAIRSAKRVDGKSTSSVVSGQKAHPSITFVLSSRQTVTFTMDLTSGLISRSGETWRPEGDLKSLVTTAIKKP